MAALSIHHFRQAKQAGQPLVALTAADYATAQILDRAGIDLILVGDSLAMTSLGHSSTLPLTLEQMIHHAQPMAQKAKGRCQEHQTLHAGLLLGHPGGHQSPQARTNKGNGRMAHLRQLLRNLPDLAGQGKLGKVALVEIGHLQRDPKLLQPLPEKSSLSRLRPRAESVQVDDRQDDRDP